MSNEVDVVEFADLPHHAVAKCWVFTHVERVSYRVDAARSCGSEQEVWPRGTVAWTGRAACKLMFPPKVVKSIYSFVMSTSAGDTSSFEDALTHTVPVLFPCLVQFVYT